MASLLEFSKKTKYDEKNKCEFKIETDICTYSSCMRKGNISKILSLLGRGSFGEVYQVCTGINEECPYALKIVLFKEKYLDKSSDTDQAEKFLKEIKFQQKASDINVAPKIITYWICPIDYKNQTIQAGFIIMEKWDITLNDFIVQNLKEYYEQYDTILNLFEYKITKLVNSTNFIHTDIHDGNIMLKLNDKKKVIDLTIIDWGKVKILPHNRTENDEKIINKILNYIRLERTKDIVKAEKNPILYVKYISGNNLFRLQEEEYENFETIADLKDYILQNYIEELTRNEIKIIVDGKEYHDKDIFKDIFPKKTYFIIEKK